MSVQHRIDDLAELGRKKLEARLDDLDRKIIRPLAEIQNGTATDKDIAMLADLKAEKDKLRAEMFQLTRPS